MSGTNIKNGSTAAASSSEALKASFASNAKQAASALRNLEDALKNISEHSPVLSKAAQVMDRQRDMELEIQKTHKRIADLELSYQIQTEEIGKSYAKWKEQNSQLEHQVRKIEADLTAKARDISKEQKTAHAREVGELRKELETEKKKVATRTEELNQANAKTKMAEARLKEWERYVSLLKDVDFKAFDGKVKQLFERCLNIVRNYFLQDLPQKVLADQGQWDNLPHSLNVPLSFPPTNTPAARYVRMAASLHIISRRLYTDFFKPCYIPESADVSEAIKEILAQHYMIDARKERITRALFLSTYAPEEVDTAIKQAVDTASKDVLELLSPIGGNEPFRKDLEKLFNEAAGVWREAQQSTKMVQASVTDEFEDWSWAQLDEFTSAVTGTEAQQGFPKFDMLHLFPRICVPEDNHIVSSGYVLWPSQNVVFVAEQEFSQWIASKRFKGGRNGSLLGRPRRLSMRNNERNGAEPVEKHSFLETRRPQTQGNQAQNGNRGEG
ncbi:hypothetical protein MMC30_004326 [Trapelia coarctata]|nr:hypothetical protein [Trapelia coarctata]